MKEGSVKYLSIYIDMRGSSKLSLKEKKKEYGKLYSEFSSYKPSWMDNINFHYSSSIGDAVLLVFNANSLNNKKELFDLLKEIEEKVDKIDTDKLYGIGISYTEGFNQGQFKLISPSIDYACQSSSVARKWQMEKWKWALKLNIGEDDKADVTELEDIIVEWENDGKVESKKSSSGKNRYFNCL